MGRSLSVRTFTTKFNVLGCLTRDCYLLMCRVFSWSERSLTEFKSVIGTPFHNNRGTPD